MIKGVVLSLFASCLFGLVYYYPVLLRPLPVMDVFCWRLLTTLPAVAILVTVSGKWTAIFNLIKRGIHQPLFALAMLCSAALLSIQMLIFVWAPLNGHALSTSLGYFMLPLTMVICGRIFYQEQFSIFKIIAIVLACAGVVLEVYITGAFSWETAVIALGYPLYFMLRRKCKMDGLEGTFSDFFLISLGCLAYFIVQYDMAKIIDDIIVFHFYIPMLGIITAVAFAAYFAASRLLPLSLLGLLGYVEPVLLVIVSMLFLHETINADHVIPYTLIWLAVCMLVLEGLVYVMRSIKRQRFKYAK